MGPCERPHAKCHTNEEVRILEIVKKGLEPWRRVPNYICDRIAYKAGDLRNVFDDHVLEEAGQDCEAARERSELIKNY